MSKAAISRRLGILTQDVNVALREAHEAGLSVSVGTNGYYVQLQESELLKVDIRVNNCRHRFRAVKSIEQEIEGLKRKSIWGFERCTKCHMTRSRFPIK